MIASETEIGVWSKAEPNIKSATRQRNTNDLGAMIFPMSLGNTKRAAATVFRWLRKDKNAFVSDVVENMNVHPTKKTTITKLIVQSIHASIWSQTQAKALRIRVSERPVKKRCGGLSVYNFERKGGR